MMLKPKRRLLRYQVDLHGKQAPTLPLPLLLRRCCCCSHFRSAAGAAGGKPALELLEVQQVLLHGLQGRKNMKGNDGSEP